MGHATFRAPAIPMNGPTATWWRCRLQLADGTTVSATVVSVGNPHCWSSSSAVDSDACRRVGPMIEKPPGVSQPHKRPVREGRDKKDARHPHLGAAAPATRWPPAPRPAAPPRGREERPVAEHGAGDGAHAGRRPRRRRAPDWSLKLEGPVEEVYTGVLNDAFAEGLAHSRHAVTRNLRLLRSSAVNGRVPDAARALAAELARRRLGPLRRRLRRHHGDPRRRGHGRGRGRHRRDPAAAG